MKFDVIVIGTGPSGESAAINSAKQGLKTAIVEEKEFSGGNSLFNGTIPSKALREAVKQIINFNRNELFRRASEPKTFHFEDLTKYSQSIIQKQTFLKQHHYSRNRITVFNGVASFKDKNTIIVNNKGVNSYLFADKIVIATGSRPYMPDDIDFDHERVYNSDTILSMKHTPKTIIIYGAGVIGCEYASIFSGLGVKVDLVDNRDKLLSFLDHEISDALSYHLRSGAVKIRHNEVYESVSFSERSVNMYMKSGKVISADCLLFTNGRSGNTAGLNLEAVGITANSRGQLEVDNNYMTSVEGIYAVGDVIGWPSLASAALDQGREASSNFVHKKEIRFVDEVPNGIYTIPEISSVGATEEELTKDGVSYEVGQALFKDIARAQISGDPVGMLKILFDRNTKEILGVHCFGNEASEIVHIGQAVMKSGPLNSIEYFVNNTFNYPTMAEAYRIAALAGLSRIKV